MSPRTARFLSRFGWMVAAIALGVAAAWAGMVAWGTSTVALGPFRVQLAARLGPGDTIVSLPPLGQLRADTHTAPLTIHATLQSVNVADLTARVRADGIDELVDQTERAGRRAIPTFALRVIGVATGTALVLAGIAFRRRWRRILLAVLAALLVTSGSEAATWATYRPQALLSPTYSGTLALAPKLIGPVQETLGRIDEFRTQLARIVEGSIRVFTSIRATALPATQEIRVLHVSDIHLSPLGMSFALELARAFDVDLVIDTGDITSFGTPAETLALSQIPLFRRPYVFVRGNHDSPEVEAAMRRVRGAVVLDGEARLVRGLLVYGLGDPAFTPDRRAALDDAAIARLDQRAAIQVREDVTILRRPPDIVAVHDDRMAASVAGLVPLVISGHFHVPSARVVDATLFLRDGSTGGAGADVYTEEGGVPLSAEILTFSRTDPPRLVAYDLVQQSPETGSLIVKRQLPGHEPGAGPAPVPTTSPSPGPLPGSPPGRPPRWRA